MYKSEGPESSVEVERNVARMLNAVTWCCRKFIIEKFRRGPLSSGRSDFEVLKDCRYYRITTSLSSVSDACEASVSPSQDDWLSSTGLLDPEEMHDDDPMVHSSLLSWRKS